MEGWKEKVSFKKSGKRFTVEVVGWDEFKRWNVYAYIYPGHALFLEGGSMFNCSLPLSGLSFFEKHYHNGALSCLQWGNDYDHEWHSDYQASDKERQAKHDAKELFEFLETVSRPHCEAERPNP